MLEKPRSLENGKLPGGDLQQRLFGSDIVLKLHELTPYRIEEAVLVAPELEKKVGGRGSKPRPLRAPAPNHAGAGPCARPQGEIVFRQLAGTPRPRLDDAEALGCLQCLNEFVARTAAAELVPLFTQDPAQLETEVRHLELRSGKAFPNPSSFAILALPEEVPFDHVEQVRDALVASPLVEYAHIAPLPLPPNVDISPTTPALPGQGYLAAAPGGVDAMYAWTREADGRGVQLIDVEGTWDLDHEDLPRLAYDGSGIGSWGVWDRNHGTSVLGVIAAERNAYGFTGISPQVGLGVSTSIRPSAFAGAILDAALHLDAGDVMVIPLHLAGPTTDLFAAIGGSQAGFVPVDFYPASHLAVQLATARGVIVVEAGGNGSVDLDLPIHASRIGNTGAIMVGAGVPSTRAPESFSNFGSRVDLQGWGEGVATLGHASRPGDISIAGDDQRQWYTSAFSGTSSASPIVAAACACVQSLVKQQGHEPLDGRQMRDLLVATGTPQASSPRHIGPLPNLRAALDRIDPPTVRRAQWPTLAPSPPQLADAPTVATLPGAELAVFFISTEGVCNWLHQTAPSNGWSGATAVADQHSGRLRFGGCPIAVPTGAGLELFARSVDGHVWHVWQDDRGRWGDWTDLGGDNATSDPSATLNADNRIEVFVRWQDGSVRHNWQLWRRGPWAFGGWGNSLGGEIAGRPVAVRNRDGRLEAFGLDRNQRVQSTSQISPGGTWSSWGRAGAQALSAEPNAALHPASGRVFLFGLAPDRTLMIHSQVAPGASFGGSDAPWQQLTDVRMAPGARPAVRATASGSLAVFCRMADNQIGHSAMDSSPGGWTAWQALGGEATSDPAVGVNADTRLEAFARGSSGGELVHRWEPW